MLKTRDVKIKSFDYLGACSFYMGAIIVTLVCQAAVGIVSAVLSGAYPDIASNGDFLTAFMIVIQAANAAYILLYCRQSGYRFDCRLAKSKATDKVDPRDFVLPVLAAVVLLVGMYLPTVWYGYFTRYALHIPPSAGNVDLSTASSVAMIVIASVFSAPICEEAIYRGILFNGLKREKTALKAVLFSALAFMLMHMSPLQVVFQFALGALSAFIMLGTNRLLPCVILHATANAAALAIQYDPIAGGINGAVAWLAANPVAATFITLGLFVACVGALFVLVRFGYGVKSMRSNADVIADPDENAAVAAARRSDGTMRYWIGIVICAVLWIINLITMVTS